jgi:DNA-binding MurR/RpiR family transcriptional regulator
MLKPNNATLQGAGAVASTIGRLYPHLSKSHRKTADYVLANTFRAATMTIDELSVAAGISLATANRFAHALGFDGYAPFRNALVADFASSLAPVEKMRTEVQKSASTTEIMASALINDIHNIDATRLALVPAHCEQVVDLILQADRIFVVGFGASAFLSGIMAHALEPFCRTVLSGAQPGGPSQTARQFIKLDQRDVVIAMAFPRYVVDTVRLVQRAVEKNAKVIALTDSPESPLVPLAEVSLYAHTERQLSPTSDAAALALIQAICDAVAHRAKRPVQAASEMTEFVLPWLYQRNQLAPSISTPGKVSASQANAGKGTKTVKTATRKKTS